MKRILFLIIFMLTSISLIGCTASQTEDRVLSDKQWIQDIEYLDNELKTSHANLYKYISEEEWNQNIENLKSDVPNLSDVDIKLRMSQIVASIQDGHTMMVAKELYLPVPSPTVMGEFLQEVENILVFPIMVRYFDDGIRVIESDEKNKEILGARLIAINGIDINKILANISTLYSGEYQNNQKPLLEAITYLNVYDNLQFFEIVDTTSATFEFENKEGDKISTILEATNNQDINYIWKDTQKLKTSITQEGKSQNYWFENYEEDDIVYFQLNTFKHNPKEDSDMDFYKVVDELVGEIKKSSSTKLVIDLRNNRGGYIQLGEYLSSGIKHMTDLEGEDIYVLTSMQTFSAGGIYAHKLQREIGAKVVGEETGGNVNLFSAGYQFELPNSKLKPLISGREDIFEEGYVGGVKPNIEIKQNYEDYVNGIDTAYEYIKSLY